MGLRGMQRAGGAAALGAATATNWVLKDTLGKIARMALASRMGCKFVPDAKRWRFHGRSGDQLGPQGHPREGRADGVGLQDWAQVRPGRQAVAVPRLAALRAGERAGGVHAAGGGVENIGDITAKGEAQIAVVDLLGIASGIFLSRESASLAVAVPPSSRTVPPSLTGLLLPKQCLFFMDASREQGGAAGGGDEADEELPEGETHGLTLLGWGAA